MAGYPPPGARRLVGGGKGRGAGLEARAVWIGTEELRQKRRPCRGLGLGLGLGVGSGLGLGLGLGLGVGLRLGSVTLTITCRGARRAPADARREEYVLVALGIVPG